MAFDTRKQSVPKVFLEKIEIDKVIDKMKRDKVVELVGATEALKEQKLLRRKCEMTVIQSRVDPMGDGTPGAGTVFKPKNLMAVAA